MTASDEDVYRRAVGRMLWLIALLAAGGTLVLLFWRGWKWGAGFVFGAGIAWVNFLMLKKMTDSLGATGRKPPSTGSVVFLGSRYLILGGVAYVILRFTSISMPAALAGLFVSLVAVLAEILFELLYARN